MQNEQIKSRIPLAIGQRFKIDDHAHSRCVFTVKDIYKGETSGEVFFSTTIEAPAAKRMNYDSWVWGETPLLYHAKRGELKVAKMEAMV